MERVYNKVQASVEVTAVVDVELTDEQILKAVAEIWMEDPTKCMGQIIAYASDPLYSTTTDSELDLH